MKNKLPGMKLLKKITTPDKINLYNRRPNGWTEWAEIFCGHSLVAGGCQSKNKFEFFLFIFSN